MKAVAGLLAGLLLTACASAGGPTAGPRPAGYLSDAAVAALADTARTPTPLDADVGVFDRVAPGSDRWQLAIVQAELRPPEAAQHFDCILGARLMARPRPALSHLLTRLAVDAETLTAVAARRAPRDRPVMMAGIEPCQRTTETSRRSPSWPAGGAVVGAAYGAAFADLAPDQAQAARARGRDLGESRAVCRMNWPSDVTDGARLGLALYAEASAQPGFAADLAAARIEVDAARAEGLTNPACAFERRALRPVAG